MAETVIGPEPPNDGREWDAQCARCGSSVERRECETCGGEGVEGHDCGEDVCCCADPDEPNLVCEICFGEGGWWACLSDDGPSPTWCERYPLIDREPYAPGTPEWWTGEEVSR